MSTHQGRPVADAWDVGPRVTIIGAVDSGRWTTLERLLHRALVSGYAVVVADQGLDPLGDRLEVLGAEFATRGARGQDSGAVACGAPGP